MTEIECWAREAVTRARDLGIPENRVVLDPGVGFGKTAEQNLEIIRNLNRLTALGFPVLVGTSRKSFIGKILGNMDAGRSWGTAAAVAASILCGAHIVRVHDVSAMRDVARVTDALLSAR
jgi:dihydropteroate synthase